MIKLFKMLFLVFRYYPEVRLSLVYELKFNDGSDCKIFTKDKRVAKHFRKQKDVKVTRRLICRKGRYYYGNS